MRASAAGIRGNGNIVCDAQLHGPQVERAYQRAFVAVGPRVDGAPHTAPYDHVAAGDDLCAGVHVADDNDVAHVPYDPP